MSRATPDDQLKFLLSCVRHSNNGKIDFVEVAGECGVVSKGAAAKRYERLLKANGIHPNGGPVEKLAHMPTKPKSKAEIARSAAAKRRKIEGDMFDCKDDEEDEFEPRLKAEPFDATVIKPEPDAGYLPMYGFQQMVAAPQQQLFQRGSRPMIPQFLMPSAFTPSFMQAPFQPRPHRFSYVLPPTDSDSSAHTTPQVQTHMPETSHMQPKPLPQPISTVPEEQIQSMFDEFCAQDLFKRSEFSGSTESTEPVAITPDSLVVGAFSEHQPLPNTIDGLVKNGLDTQAQTACEKSSDFVPPVPPALTVKEPTGSGIEDSILIVD